MLFQVEVDKMHPRRELGGVMKKRAAKPARKKIDWPEETDGDRLAAEIRKRCNKLTKEQREELFKQAMAMISGSNRTASIFSLVTGPGLDKAAACSDLRVKMKKAALTSAKKKVP